MYQNSGTISTAALGLGTHGLQLKAKADAFNVQSIIITTGSGPVIPPAPAGLTATGGNTQVALIWNASTSATSYNVKRSTTSGSGYVTVSSPTAMNYTDTGLTNGTTYYYVVTAVNTAGESGNSPQASATPSSGGTSGPVKINCGGPAASPFVADTDFSGGLTATNNTGAVDTSAVTSPAPTTVYQSERYGATFTYTIGGFTANSSNTVRLHFTEDYWTVSGSRVENVTINGAASLTNFDIFATAGAIHKANIQQFTVNANSSGQYVIVFTAVAGHADTNAKVDGIEVNTIAPPAAPTGLTATAGNAQVVLSWTASSGATSYNVYRGTTAGGENGTAIATGIATTSYTNTGLTNGTTYYYKVNAVNGGGTSGYSNEVNAKPVAPPGIAINAGGPAASPFVADTDFSGGTAATNWTGAVNTSAVTNPAPQAVYQSERYGATFTYTIGGFTANSPRTVRLHFTEDYWTASGSRVENVTINSAAALTNFDIFATAGAIHKANIQQFTVNANASGQFVIVFTAVTGHSDTNAKVDGIEVI